jgi:hypothetical protein
MRIAVNTQAAPISSEKTLLERLRKLSRRPDGKTLRRILIENDDEQPRVSIETATPSEEAGIRQLLEDHGFRDRAPVTADDAKPAGDQPSRDSGRPFTHDVFDVVYRFLGN